MKYCPKCGTKLNDNDAYCTKCGAPQSNNDETMSATSTNFIMGDEVVAEVVDSKTNRTNEIKSNRKGKGIAAFTLGLSGITCIIISWFALAIPLSCICMACGIVGTILGAKCLNKYGNALGIVGFVFSVIDIILGLVVFIIMITR